MPRIINCKIDVKKLDKKKLYVGEKGTYANITLIETPGGKYGDWMVIEDKAKGTPKEEKGTILGNGKNYGWGTSGGGESQQNRPSQAPISTDDMPF